MPSSMIVGFGKPETVGDAIRDLTAPITELAESIGATALKSDYEVKYRPAMQ